MGFQFIREECYARVRAQAAPDGKKGASRAGRGKISAREVIAEVVRLPGASPHVLTPTAPRILYGLDTEELPLWLDQIEAMALDVKVDTVNGPRRQRSDTPILMGVIATYPSKADENDPLYIVWRSRVLEFFKRRYGSNLVSVLEHNDERFGHLHAEITHRGMSVKTLHAGHEAMLESASRGESKKEQSAAYINGARILQDQFFKEVSVESGLARTGPKRRRMTRAQWQAQNQAAGAAALSILCANESIRASGEAALASTRLVKNAQREVSELQAEAFELQKECSQHRQHFERHRTAISALERSVRLKETELASALTDASIVKLQTENVRLRDQVNLLSGLVTGEQESHFAASLPAPQARSIFQKL